MNAWRWLRHASIVSVTWAKQHPKQVVGGLVIVAMVVFAAYHVEWRRKKLDVRAALAKALGVPPEAQDLFFLNLPPKPGAYPGTLVPAGSRGFIDAVPSDDAGLERGDPVAFDAFEEANVDTNDSLVASLIGAGSRGSGKVESLRNKKFLRHKVILCMPLR